MLESIWRQILAPPSPPSLPLGGRLRLLRWGQFRLSRWMCVWDAIGWFKEFCTSPIFVRPCCLATYVVQPLILSSHTRCLATHVVQPFLSSSHTCCPAAYAVWPLTLCGHLRCLATHVVQPPPRLDRVRRGWGSQNWHLRLAIIFWSTSKRSQI
jgi:hypothetical protein